MRDDWRTLDYAEVLVMIGEGAKGTLTPFTRQFPVEILDAILQHRPMSSLPICLRVSKQWLQIAGRILYARIEISGLANGRILMTRAETIEARTTMFFGGRVNAGRRTLEPESTNFKQILLEFVKTLVVKFHKCPEQPSEDVVRTHAAKQMTGLERLILVPPARWAHSPCFIDVGCPLLLGLKYKSITIHNIQEVIKKRGPAAVITEALDKAQHATLIVPPTDTYMNEWTDSAEDLARPTQNLSSIRIIVAHGTIDSHPWSSSEVSLIASVQQFLASFIKFKTQRIEIYLFHNFNNNLDLDKFRQALKSKVEKQYQDAIKSLKERNELEPEHTDWSADYEVYDLEDYFKDKKMLLELDHDWMRMWKRELDRRRRSLMVEIDMRRRDGTEDTRYHVSPL